MAAPLVFAGVYTALVTPFTAAGDVDWECYAELLEKQAAAGVAGVVPVRVGRVRVGGWMHATAGGRVRAPLAATGSSPCAACRSVPLASHRL